MRLYIVRHGETDYNRKRMMQGYHEIPLNDLGIAQATQLALRLKGESLDRIVSSDLRRAVMTGCVIASHTGVPMTYEPGLRERDPGELVEQSYDKEPRFFSDEHFVPPGGEGTAEFRARVKQAFEGLVRDGRHPGERVAVVTHGLVCHAFVTQFFGEAQGAGVGSRNTSMTIVDYADGVWSLAQLNCVSHLPAETAAIGAEVHRAPGA